jgi:hypothetical protein
MSKSSMEPTTMAWPSGWFSLRLVGSALSAFVFFISCTVRTQDRPAPWATPQVAADPQLCPPITGVYENQGVDAKGSPVNLVDFLHCRIKNDTRPYAERFGYELNQILRLACRVDLDLSESGVLDVRAVTGAGIRSWRLEQAKDQFKCINGMVRIEWSGDASDQQAIVHKNFTLDLYRQGNDLIVHRQERSFGALFILPVGAVESTWARFHALEGASRTLGDPFAEIAIGSLLPAPDKSRQIAITATRTAPCTEIDLGCVGFLAAVDESGKVIYLSTSSPMFRTPEGIGTGASVRNVWGAGGSPLTTEVGWGRYSVLPSGWCARFPEHAQGTNSTGYPTGVVTEFFKRE